MNDPLSGVSRRGFLAGSLAVGAGALGTGATLFGQDRPARPSLDGIDRFLRSLVKQDGGYGWLDEPDSHLTPTFAAVGAYRAMKRAVPDRQKLAQYIRTHHPVQFTRPESPLHNFELQQIQALTWLEEDVSDFKQAVLKRVKPYAYPAVYEQHRWPIFQMETTAFLARELLKLPMKDLDPEFIRYLESRRRANGSFNNTPAEDGSDGHIVNTWWGVQAMRALGRGGEKLCETAGWVQQCQLKSGGFTHGPRPAMAGVDDAMYTWAAVKILDQMGGDLQRQRCIEYLISLWNPDGGFGDRPGWTSNAVATYYAVDALAMLGALDRLPERPAARPVPATLEFVEGEKVFTIQIEAPGRGSPVEAVELARSLGIHLWGAKNSPAGWIERAQAVARERRVPVTFFAANEEYGTFVSVPGMGTYSHTSDIIAPAGKDFGKPVAGSEPMAWEEFRRRRMAPLEQAGGRLVWQFGENEELCRLYLDDSVERGAYAAISTFHFGNPDFTISQPFLLRYRHKLPYIALQDAHGEESWWWGDMLEGFRTLFVAREPTWEGWMAALKSDRVVAVRRDEVTGQRLRMHGGAPGAQEFVMRNALQWQWWDRPFRRRAASIVVVRPEDRFEKGRPEKGIALRVRCVWVCTKQGLPKTAVTELLELKVDGKVIKTQRVQARGAKGALADVYEHCELDLTPGRHSAVAMVRDVKNGAMTEMAVEVRV